MSNPVNPKKFKFCPACGNELKEKFINQEQTKRLMCDSCGFIFYMNPVPAVAVILMRDKQILLVKRKYDPRKGGWTLPAGFMEWTENPEQTAIRETKEETNLDIAVKEFFCILSGFDDPRVHVILIVYKGEILNGDIAPGDDAEDVQFFPLDNLPKNIAFSAHQEVLKMLTRELL